MTSFPPFPTEGQMPPKEPGAQFLCNFFLKSQKFFFPFPTG